MSAFDLDAYLGRIGYHGPQRPTLAVLHSVTAAQAQAIPFENLAVLLGHGVRVDIDSVFDKLVHQRRGGYCFEQNTLLLYALQDLGFDVTPLAARVRLDRPRDVTPPRTHVLLRVVVDGRPWLTDVGVGAASLTSAILLDTDADQVTPHDVRRVVQEAGSWYHQIRYGDRWNDVCEFSGEPMPAIDREIGNWFTSTHPQSQFKNRLVVARADSDGRRRTLLNGEFKLRERDGTAMSRELTSAGELLGVLRDEFGLTFPAGTRFGPADAPWPT